MSFFSNDVWLVTSMPSAFSTASIEHIVWAMLHVPQILATICGMTFMFWPRIAWVKNLLLSVNLIWTACTLLSLTFTSRPAWPSTLLMFWMLMSAFFIFRTP